ncbi:MAG: EAL domain-containing protein, partial [Gammaproteobacteria bacterium]|nr:EAL domain-containing protein [Gammaproteobacteria bacterium]
SEAVRQQLEARAGEAEALGQQVAELNAALQQAEQRQQEHEAHSVAAGEWQQQVDALNSRLQQSEAARQQLEVRAGEAEALGQQVAELNAALQQAEQRQQEHEERAGAAGEWQQQVDALNTRLQQSESARQQLEAEAQALAKSANRTVDEEIVIDTPDHQGDDTVCDSNTELAILKNKDMQTGLYNRQYFIESLENQLGVEHSNGAEQAMFYILLDNYMRIREEVGIVKADLVINKIATHIKDCCGDTDTVARFGDYSFAVIHNSDSIQHIQDKAEEIRMAIETFVVDVDGQSVITTASIGICVLNQYPGDVQSILSRADMSLEVARTSGGNQAHIHSTIIDEQVDVENESEWDSVVRKTIEEKRLYLVYQPIISLNEDKWQRYEVLLRVLDQEGNIILPGQFVSVAEKIGMGLEIDRFVIDNAFRKLSEKDNHDIVLFVKVSDAALADTDLAFWINNKFKEYQINKDQVIFEIPENILGKNLNSAIMFTKALRAMHCKIAIEHYTGMTQSQIFKHVSVDILKIDGALIEGLDADKERQLKVRGIIDLARKEDMSCMAERIEDPASLALLWTLGLEYAQGNFIQEPSRELEYDFYGEIVSEEIMDPGSRASFVVPDNQTADNTES